MNTYAPLRESIAHLFRTARSQRSTLQKLAYFVGGSVRIVCSAVWLTWLGGVSWLLRLAIDGWCKYWQKLIWPTVGLVVVAGALLGAGIALRWESIDQIREFLFGSYTPLIFLLAVLVCVPRAWKSSNTFLGRQFNKGFRTDTADNVFLGLEMNSAKQVFAGGSQRDRHMALFGASGYGKTSAMLGYMESDIVAGIPVISIDMKGDRELSRKIWRLCSQTGRGEDFRFFTLDTATQCHRWNPVGWGDGKAIRDRMMGGCIWSDEQYYANAARAVLDRVTRTMLAAGKPLSFYDYYVALTQKAAYRILAEVASADDRPLFDEDLGDWPTFKKNTSGLLDNLMEFASPELKDRLCVADADITMLDVAQNDRVAHFELSSNLYKQAGPSLGRMLLEEVSALVGVMAQRGAKQVALYIDEAGDAVYDGFVPLIRQCRSSGVRIVLSTQSPFDYGDAKQAVVQNTDLKVIFRQPDPESAEEAAAIVSTVLGVAMTEQSEEGAWTGMGSKREVHEYIVHPSVIKQLGIGVAACVAGDYRGLLQTPWVASDAPPMLPEIKRGTPKAGYNLAGILAAKQEKNETVSKLRQPPPSAPKLPGTGKGEQKTPDKSVADAMFGEAAAAKKPKVSKGENIVRGS